ncbi:exported hypothetical protein [Arthrobacter sp. 9AX]|nr:exported hypothetical protein [Arthrobacter sp. 9AX]
MPTRPRPSAHRAPGGFVSRFFAAAGGASSAVSGGSVVSVSGNFSVRRGDRAMGTPQSSAGPPGVRLRTPGITFVR